VFKLSGWLTMWTIRIISKKLVKDNATAVMDEINVLKGLDHPNIVHVWDHFESRDK
jgi:calcium/calmodulin-dependent protein kinase I